MKKSPLFASPARIPLASVLLATIFLTVPAFADDVTSKSESAVEQGQNGGYVATDKMENTTSNGTVMKHDSTKELSIDKSGNREKTQTVKTSTDPKGLMNKSTTEVKDKTVEKDGKVKTSHTKTIDGKTTEDSTDTQQ
jgi:hypothetical protein